MYQGVGFSAVTGHYNQSICDRETKFSGANGDKEISIFPVQLTTCRIANLTRLIHTLAMCVTVHPYYIYIYIYTSRDTGVASEGGGGGSRVDSSVS